MEEKKEQKEPTVQTKTVEMTPKNKPEDNRKHSKEEVDLQMELDGMSKEKLKELCGQLYYRNNKLMERIQNMDMTNIFRRLDYLFKVLETPNLFTEKFIAKVTTEICEGMYPSEETSSNG